MRPPPISVAPETEPRTSGVFSKSTLQSLGPSLQEILVAMRDTIPSGLVGVLLKTSCGRPLRARFDPSPSCASDAQSAVELRMTTWLAGIEKVRAPVVPEFLKAWIPLERALVLPMYTPVWQAGFLIVEPAVVTREGLRELNEVAVQYALEIETADRQYRHQVLQDVVETTAGHSIPVWLAQRRTG